VGVPWGEDLGVFYQDRKFTKEVYPSTGEIGDCDKFDVFHYLTGVLTIFRVWKERS